MSNFFFCNYVHTINDISWSQMPNLCSQCVWCFIASVKKHLPLCDFQWSQEMVEDVNFRRAVKVPINSSGTLWRWCIFPPPRKVTTDNIFRNTIQKKNPRHLVTFRYAGEQKTKFLTQMKKRWVIKLHFILCMYGVTLRTRRPQWILHYLGE